MGGISEHFIWQVDLVEHFIWKVDLILWLFRMGSHWRHDSLSGHFIWKYELISDVHVLFILFTSSDNYQRGVYLTAYLDTSSENMKSFQALHLVHFIWQPLGGISDTLSGHFIWKYEHFIWQLLGHISESENFIWKYELISSFQVWVSVCTSSETGGVYLTAYLNTSSVNMNSFPHFGFGSQCALHLSTSSETGGVYLTLNTSSENLSSQMFRCGHHRGLFASHKTNYYCWGLGLYQSNKS